jgi:hypothetical protein
VRRAHYRAAVWLSDPKMETFEKERASKYLLGKDSGGEEGREGGAVVGWGPWGTVASEDSDGMPQGVRGGRVRGRKTRRIRIPAS